MTTQMPMSPAERRPVFQNAYVWLIFLASLDIIFTWVVLWHHGIELNPLAAKLIHHGPKGLVLYKFSLMIVVIALCEIVGRRNRRAAHFLIGAAIGLTCVPVLLAMVLLIGQQHGVFR